MKLIPHPARLSVALLLASIFIVALPQTSHAQRPASAVSANLRLAGSGFGPVPANAVISQDALARIAADLRQQKWTLPPASTPWPVVEGRPVVSTEHLDQMWHTVEPGETARRLRHMYRVSRAQLDAWNPQVDLDALSAGQRVLVWTRADRPSMSIGYAHHGRLFDGEPLPPDDRYVILYPYRTFGTYYTVSETRRALDEYYTRYPNAHPLMVGDISFRNGRKISPHKSHQTGRDIDISYPRKSPPPSFKRFHHVRRDQLDVPRTLSLIKSFIDGGQVEYIFMDRWFQRMLRYEAANQGAPEEWLNAVFQYPHWSGGRAIIRHSSGHRNHFHIRFKCQQTDRRCR